MTQDTPTLDAPAELQPERCVHCKQHEPVAGYPTKLCSDCRAHFIRYPMPKWLLLFAGIIGLVMIAGLARMPRYLAAGIHMGRGEKAAAQHRYRTVSREMDLVLAKVPSSLEAHIYKLIAASYNLDGDGVQSAYAFLENKKIENKDLYSEMESAINFVQPFFVQDSSMNRKMELAAKDSVNGLLQLNREMDDSSTGSQAVSRYLIADKLYDWKAYEACETVLQAILRENDRMYAALGLMAGVKREQKEYDQAISYCDRMLAINQEDVGGFVQKAKIELKRNNDVKALQYADEAMRIDPEDVRSLEAKTLAEFLMGKKDESRKLLAHLVAVEPDSEKLVYRRTALILNGTEKYR